MIQTIPENIIDGYKPSDRVLVLGMCPSGNNRRRTNGTLSRLQFWMNHCRCPEWTFHNVIPNVADSTDVSDVDVDQLWNAIEGKEKVVALGGFVSRVCDRFGIEHFKCDHPSPRNRNLNDHGYEMNLIGDLAKYLHED